MTLSAIGAPSRGQALASPRALAFVAITLALGLIALVTQAHFGLIGDVSWLITVDEKWLSGQVPYRDVIEINPPASLLLYWPQVRLAHALGLTPEFAVAASGFAAIGASLALSALILKRAGLSARAGPIAYGVALIALMVLPGEAFCERDHLAAVFALPSLAMAVARAERAPVDVSLAALAGIGAGMMAAIKPPYALVAFALLAYLARRNGWRAAIGATEYYVAGAVGLAYVAIVFWDFPYYTADVMKMGVDIYVPVRDSLGGLLVEAGALLVFTIAIPGAKVAGENLGKPWIAVPALAALGAFAAFVIQGKGWLYQAQPALMFLTIAAGFAIEARKPSRLETALGAMAMILAAIVVVAVHNLAPPLLVATAAAGWPHRRLAPGEMPDRARAIAVLSRHALAAAIGAACGLCVADRPLAPALETALARLGPHATVAGITEVLGFGHPLVRHAGATWVARVPSQWITSAARRLIDEHPGDAALAARMRPYLERDRKMLVEDILRERPDALLAGPLNTRLHAALWADPEIAAAITNYRLFATQDGPEFPAELWVRRDLAEAGSR